MKFHMPTMTSSRALLVSGLGGAIIFLATWVAKQFGIDPWVALLAFFLTIVSSFVILFLVRVRLSAEYSAVYPGTPEQLFQMGTDVKLKLQVNPGRTRLLSQTGEPGQPGSSYVIEISPGVVRTTTVVSSDPPRKLVTTTTGTGICGIDLERTYTPVAEGTLLEGRSRTRMALLTWLLRPVFKRGAEAETARANARIRDYLASVTVTQSGVGD